ncbi:hypothetical protein [Cellulomonas chengniuliangii]|uniref:hypothetical protein n=1 Tax=Cellulomonas chengniuliangii TaxID=2968084 RepID=UPI001D0DD969|nr:hypothetical protein [Cellulomonas chengniuliangii]MCC2319269.1 hypothetical protein [Cellulomonas chengniuliangii]
MAEDRSTFVDRSGYLGVRSRGAATFNLGARLPDQVFKGDVKDSLFCEFDAVLTREFWPALCAMAQWHGDSEVELLVLEPDCDAFYRPMFGLYPALSLSVRASMDDYWAMIGHEPDGNIMGSIAISANVIAVTGSSGEWGCWGERDPEVAVFRGFPDGATRSEWSAQFGPFLEVSGALESYLPLAFEGRIVPDEFAATLAANYGNARGARP